LRSAVFFSRRLRAEGVAQCLYRATVNSPALSFAIHFRGL
jgi:hypothetical protein